MTTGPKIEDHVSVSTACLELSEIAAIVADPRAGAISTFSGTTRDNHFGKKVVRLEYEGYVPMAELELKKICVQVRARWNVLRIALVHRLGVTAVGEASVIIAISSVHRKDSLEAVEFAINTLKATVPIWKLEVYEGDGRVWKENAEWGPGGGCCRKMVPVEGSAKNNNNNNNKNGNNNNNNNNNNGNGNGNSDVGQRASGEDGGEAGASGLDHGDHDMTSSSCGSISRISSTSSTRSDSNGHEGGCCNGGHSHP